MASAEWGITTTLEDCKHGSETQASLVLARLHAAACGSCRLPEKLCIGADNTPKETKNFVQGFETEGATEAWVYETWRRPQC